jgi:hypothetical protein
MKKNEMTTRCRHVFARRGLPNQGFKGELFPFRPARGLWDYGAMGQWDNNGLWTKDLQTKDLPGLN